MGTVIIVVGIILQRAVHFANFNFDNRPLGRGQGLKHGRRNQGRQQPNYQDYDEQFDQGKAPSLTQRGGKRTYGAHRLILLIDMLKR